MAAAFSFIVSCEHASAAVPDEYAETLSAAAALMPTHRASDLGALKAARQLAGALQAPLLAGEVTRLLVDLNRSASNPRVFSPFSRQLSRRERATLLARHHEPHRLAVRAAVHAAPPPVLHLAIHSFTPVLHGQRRRADIGLLYDPRRPAEKALATSLQAALKQVAPDLKVRRNYPYRGASDGLATWLRRQFGPQTYLGLEIELNQADWNPACQAWRSLPEQLIQALLAVFLRTDS